jgi:putative ABC transport system permease protein
MLLIALKMLFGDPMKLIGLVFGISFSTLLMSQQGGFFIGLISRAANVISDAREATIWVMDPQTETVEGPTNMRATELLRARYGPQRDARQLRRLSASTMRAWSA